jgi:glycine cleavage system H lipoate-binding protein
VKLSGEDVLIGITDFAVQELCSGNEGDLVYCDLPEAGRLAGGRRDVRRDRVGEGRRRSQRARRRDGGRANIAIEEHLEILSQDPWNQGWLIRVQPRSRSLDAPELMDAPAYEAMISAEKH